MIEFMTRPDILQQPQMVPDPAALAGTGHLTCTVPSGHHHHPNTLASSGSSSGGGSSSAMASDTEDGSPHMVEIDDSEMADTPTHLALVLKRSQEAEESYAFVDLKYFTSIRYGR